MFFCFEASLIKTIDPFWIHLVKLQLAIVPFRVVVEGRYQQALGMIT